MNIPSVNPGLGGASTGAPAPRKTGLSQEDFLNLFTTQMKFQNPLEPLDNYQMASQLAQFNTVDSLARMNDTLTQLKAQQNSMNNLQASSLIGKRVEAQGSRLSLHRGAVSDGVYQLDRPGTAIIQIFDSLGRLVRQIDAGAVDASRQRIGWDGKGQGGAPLSDGVYGFRVLAADSLGRNVPVSTYRVGTVDGVSLENGTPYFQVGADRIPWNEILTILN